MFNYPLDFLMVPLQVVLFLFTMYFFIIGFFGMWRRSEVKITVPQKKFAVLVAAHNESAVIGQLIQNLQELHYPKNLYDIFVIADNCNDNTAEVASAAGAIVYERFDATKKSKGFALEWMFEKLYALESSGKIYDAVAIFDADNLVHPNFLKEMNNRLLKGDKIVQGFLDAKNPYDTWVSGTFAIAFWIIDYISHQAKTNIGLSAVLGGTGMVITLDVIKKLGWRATCLTEDMEFTMRALTHGIKTTWAADAVVYDEKPLTFYQSCVQRKRWAQGQFDVAHRFIPKMIRAGWKLKDIRIWDGCIYLFQPYFLMLSSIFLLLGKLTDYTNIYSVMPDEILIFIMIGQYLLPVIILIKVHAKIKSWLYMLVYPLFIYSWIPIIFAGFIDRNKHEWAHTIHSRSINYEELDRWKG